MLTKVLLPTQIDQAASLIKQGEIVAFPTETVYGLGALLFSESSMEKIFVAKGRPQDNPLIAHVADLNSVALMASEVPEKFYRLAESFFPGPLTLVIKRRPNVPALASGGLDTIAIRQPSNRVALELIASVGEPIVAPSANLSGKPSSTRAEHVLDDLSGKIAAVIDAGSCSIGIESTVLDLVSFEKPVILRPGHITKSQIEAVLQEEVGFYVQGPKTSPGMKYRHYAPEAPVKLFRDSKEMEAYVENSPPLKRMVLSQSKMGGKLDHFALLAQNLYANLRQADQGQYEEILVLVDDATLQDDGLMNRLTKIVEK